MTIHRSSRLRLHTVLASMLLPAIAPVIGAQVVRPQGTATVHAASAVNAPIWGFADLHVHQFNNLGFGQIMFYGSPFGPMEHALHDCSAVHGPGGILDDFGTILQLSTGASAPVGPLKLPQIGHWTGGHPKYDGWPRWNTFTHQQVYADWLKRAHDGGLQLIVMLAGNSPALCGGLVAVRKSRLLGPAPVSCDDMPALDRQLKGAKQMEEYIDKEHGGPGRGWYRIVYTPQQAREAIGRGQLAVVLGAELPTIFDCREGSASCEPEKLRSQIAHWRSLGLRQLNPIHNVDNAFGGTAVYHDFFNYANRLTTSHWYEVRECSGEGVRFKLAAEFPFLDAVGPALESVVKTILGSPSKPPNYGGVGHCNIRGLTPVGRFVIRELMSQKMLIDVDHMSWLSTDATLAIADTLDYPVVSSHAWLLSMSRGKSLNEAQKRDADVRRIYARGGIMGPVIGAMPRSETRFDPSSGIPHDCSSSAQSYANAYLNAIKLTGGQPVAFGSDINGYLGLPSPRFGPERCHQGKDGIGPNAQQGGMVKYPFLTHGTNRPMKESVVGQKKFDINYDGVAHIGMFPDFIQELKVVGLTDAQLEPLFRSAERYIAMWEKVEASSVPPPDVKPRQMIVQLEHGPNAGDRYTVTVTALDAQTKQPVTGEVRISGTTGAQQARGSTGTPITYAVCQQYEAELKRFVGIKPCTGSVSAEGYGITAFTVAPPSGAVGSR